MTQHLLPFVSAAIITFPLFFPVAGTAQCNLEKISISLEAKDKPTEEILKDIEKQARYTIEVQGDRKTLTEKKAIKLNGASLYSSVNRLFPALNYSLICDSDRKLITIALLDKRNLPSPISSPSSQSSDMEGFTAAAQAYEEYKKHPPATKQQEPKEMKGVAAAARTYEEHKKHLPVTDQQEPKEMKGFTAAAQVYESNKKQPSDNKQVAEHLLREPDDMRGFAAAAQVYENNKTK